MRVAALVSLMLLAALAGCADSNDGTVDGEDPAAAAGDDDQATHAGDDGATPAASEGVNGTAAEGRADQPPELEVGFRVPPGGAPADVTFFVNASDPEGAAVAWAIDADGDGTADLQGDDAPGNGTFTFDAAGNHTVNVTASDGNHTVGRILYVVIEEAAPAASSFEGMDVSLSNTKDCVQCSNSGAWTSVGLNAGEQGIDISWVAIPAEAVGAAFEVTSDGPLGDPDIQWGSECTASYASVAVSYSEGSETGTVPEGALCLFVWEAVGGATIDVVIEPA